MDDFKNDAQLASVPQVGLGQAPMPPYPVTPGAPPTAAQTSWLHFKIDNLMAKLDAAAKTEEAKAGGYLKKYWPIVVGILIAATRLLH
jgi:hypothetical protein